MKLDSKTPIEKQVKYFTLSRGQCYKHFLGENLDLFSKSTNIEKIVTMTDPSQNCKANLFSLKRYSKIVDYLPLKWVIQLASLKKDFQSFSQKCL